MIEIRHATAKDVEEYLQKCEIQVWESLREILPDSFVYPKIEMVRSSEWVDNLKRLLQNKEDLLLIPTENNNILGLARERINPDGVGMPGFSGRYLKEAKNRNAHKV